MVVVTWQWSLFTPRWPFRGPVLVLAGLFHWVFIERTCNIIIFRSWLKEKKTLKKTYLWPKRRVSHRLGLFTPRRPFHGHFFMLVGRFRRYFVVRTCNIKILEVSKTKHKEIIKNLTCGSNDARRVIWARLHPSMVLFSC